MNPLYYQKVTKSTLHTTMVCINRTTIYKKIKGFIIIMKKSTAPNAKLTLLALAISAFGIGSTWATSAVTKDFGISLSTAGFHPFAQLS